MRVSYRWLLRTLGREIPLDEVVQRLILIGLEVEELIDLGIRSKRIVTAKILEVGKHPNADSLTLCRVQGDRPEPYQIVCGAKNHRAGDHVPLAMEGARLPGGFVLKRSKIRGETSEGMMCSAKELGIAEDADGLMILPQDEALYPVGAPFDAVIDIKITPNRPDALSVLGVARDLAEAFGLPAPAFPPSGVTEAGAPASASARVRIDAPADCPRYAGRVIRNVTVGPSPLWLARAVEMAGLRSINNVVDVTNLLLVEAGHPLHAFDLDLVAGGEVVVRLAREGEQVTTLDGQTAALKATDLLITDPEKPIALAGIMGCGNTEIHAGTKNVFLEAAYFNPATIRATSKRMGKSTDSSYRFERGADPQGLERVADRAARLIAEVSGGQVAPGTVAEGPGVASPAPIAMRLDRVSALVGIELTSEQVTTPLRALGFDVQADGDGAFRVTAPSFRPDVEGEADLAEEVARIHGYDRIPASPPRIQSGGAGPSAGERLAGLVRVELVAAGLNEALTYGFLAEASIARCGFEVTPGLRLRNPLSAEYAVMRPSLVPGMLDLAAYNQNHGNPDVALFEVGTVFGAWDAPAGTAARDRTGMREHTQFAALLSGAVNGSNWRNPAPAADFFDAKALGCALLARLGAGMVEAVRIADQADAPAWAASVFHPGKSAVLKTGGEARLLVGEVHPRLREALELKRNPVLVVGDFPALEPLLGACVAEKPIPTFPGAARDLALVADRDTPAAEIESVIAKRAKSLLASLTLFDVYEGDKMPEGKRSLAYTLEFSAPDRTLTDAEVNQTVEKILSDLKAKLGVEIRA